MNKHKSNVNIENLSSLEQLQKAQETLCREEEEVEKELKAVLDRRCHLDSKMTGLQKMLANVQLVHSDAQQLKEMIAFTFTLSENVNSKVRELDLAKNRVSDCMKRVEDILDVKFCTDGVQAALQNEDYEQAAAHVHRFLSLDENLLKHTAQDMHEGSTLDSSFNLLHEAEAQIKDIINHKFAEAVRDEDLASIERFFKIFPLLNQHEDGLKKFSLYLCSQVSETAQKNLHSALTSGLSDKKRANVVFADTLTLLFEGIARLIEIQQPVIETYYGPGRLPTVIEILQKECDRQAHKILEEFKKSRQLNSKVSQVCYLLKVPPHKQQDRLDPRDMDILLAEMALMNARTELYLRFIRRRMTNDVEVALQDETARKAKLQEVDSIIKNSELCSETQEFFGNYILMEEFFLKGSVAKAIQMDISEAGSTASSMVDDVFFIVKKCIRRAVSSSSVDGTCAILNNACAVLEEGFGQILQGQVRQNLPSGLLELAHAYTTTVLQQTKPIGTDTSNDASQTAFLVTLNNIDVAWEYTQTLKNNIEDDISRSFPTLLDQERAKIESCLAEFGTVAGRFKALLDQGMNQLSGNVLRPRIKPWIDTLFSVSHEITEEEYSNYEANDPWVQTLIFNLYGLLTSFKDNLTTANYDSLVVLVTNEVNTQLEKVVLKSTFNRLGGLQFDKELRALMAFLTGMTTWTIRDKFARLTQMATILNLERVSEMLDYWGQNSGSLTWRLTPSEVRQILSLRVDFRGDDIRRLKL